MAAPSSMPTMSVPKVAIILAILAAAVLPVIMPSWSNADCADPRQGHCCARHYHPAAGRTGIVRSTPCSSASALCGRLLGQIYRHRRSSALSRHRPALATAFGALIGLFVVRYREIFFGMLNLAFSMVLWSLLEKMYHYTNGADGIRVVRPTLAGIAFTPEQFQYVLVYLTLGLMINCQRGGASAISTARWGICCAPSSRTRRGWNISAFRPAACCSFGYIFSAFLAGLGGVSGRRCPADRDPGICLLRRNRANSSSSPSGWRGQRCRRVCRRCHV